MTIQEDPYKLNTEEKEELRKILQELFTNNDVEEDPLELFLRHRRQFLTSRLMSTNDQFYRVKNRLSFDVYKKNYELYATNVPASFIEKADGTQAKISFHTPHDPESPSIQAYHPSGQPFYHPVYLDQGTHLEGDKFKIHLSNRELLTQDGSPTMLECCVVYIFDVQTANAIPDKQQSFTVAIKPTKVENFEVPSHWQDVLGSPAFVTGFLDYQASENPTNESDGVVNLFLKYRES